MIHDRKGPAAPAVTARRAALRWLGVLPIGWLVQPGRACALEMTATPEQAEGPFYPRRIPADSDSDLVSVRGRNGQAKGIILELEGVVLSTRGEALAGARVEIWQCDANGRYHHVDDGESRAQDPDFQGYGNTDTDSGGRYRFRTIRPVPYPGRAPHIHFKVAHKAARPLTTQMYVAGDSTAGESGWFLRQEDVRRRLTVAVSPVAGAPRETVSARFDLVLRAAE